MTAGTAIPNFSVPICDSALVPAQNGTSAAEASEGSHVGSVEPDQSILGIVQSLGMNCSHDVEG
jgi:hypothetical protein